MLTFDLVDFRNLSLISSYNVQKPIKLTKCVEEEFVESALAKNVPLSPPDIYLAGWNEFSPLWTA